MNAPRHWNADPTRGADGDLLPQYDDPYRDDLLDLVADDQAMPDYDEMGPF